MRSGCFRFADFTFVPGERLLSRGAERIDVSSRYLDALTLLLRDRGRLVTKDRFMDEVWRGVPVTDEALTQCIRTLRRELGDDAARPRFIETVPKHGYRFIAEAKWAAGETSTATSTWPNLLRTAGFAGVGGAVAGVGGGLLYGLAMTSGAPGNGVGVISMVLVLVALNMVIGLTAGLGVGAGIAAASLIRPQGWQWSTAGGMVGGLLTGGIAKLLGLDGFALLFGHSAAGMTGAAEGALLGAAMGYSVWVAIQARLSVCKSAAVGGLGGAAAGLLVPLLGGHLLGGSLNLLARGFPDARLRLDSIGSFLGEPGFGPLSESVTATIEGGLFGFCLAGALAFAMRPRATAPFRKSGSGD